MPEFLLPESVQEAVSPLLVAMPLDQAMTQLVVQTPCSGDLTDLVRQIIQSPAIGPDSALASGLWLYVDRLDLSHDISQAIHGQTGSFWHGIMHRREGDFGNSHYWFRKVGQHPAMSSIQFPPSHADGHSYDGHAFIDDVQTGYRDDSQMDSLVARQRAEWVGLFEWCAGSAHD